MGLFNTLFGEQPDAVHDDESRLAQKEATALSGVMDGDTSRLDEVPVKKHVTLSAATGYPIDSVYEFVLRDYEEQGYNDALVNADMSYCKQAEDILRNKLDLLFERVMLIYKDILRRIEMKLIVAQEAYIATAVSALSASRETLSEHMTKLADMQQRAKDGDETFLNMIASYRRGFMKGLAAACDQLVNNNPTFNLVKNEDAN